MRSQTWREMRTADTEQGRGKRTRSETQDSFVIPGRGSDDRASFARGNVLA